MASLYKKRGVWYISLMVNNKRIAKSLRTKDFSTAKRLKSLTETTILQELNGFRESITEIEFPELVKRFLKGNHPWSKSTKELNEYITYL